MKWKRSKKVKDNPQQDSEKDIDVPASDPLNPADLSSCTTKDMTTNKQDCIVMDDSDLHMHEYDHDVDIDDDDDDDELDADCHSPTCAHAPGTMEGHALIGPENSLTEDRFSSSASVPTTVPARPSHITPPIAPVH